MRQRHALIVLMLAALATPATALAEFPYPAAPSNPGDFTQYRVGNQTPSDLSGKLQWMYAATPDDSPESALNNASPYELGGVRGAHLVDAEDGAATAWKTTTGRPDVAIAVLDSGIKWDDRSAMVDLRRKTRINRGEARIPNHDRSTPLEPLPDGLACAGFANAYDANRDGVFNVSDYACDTRVEIDPAQRAATGQPRGVGPADLLDPQDVLIAFTDGTDDDSNGFKDDMVGWDFLDDDNDPYDDVQYGHGTGEARDSTAEADNGGELASCPNCMSVHMRVGDSFVADVNNFAQSVIYAADNDVLVVQSALGTLNNSNLARDAVDYAYEHGVTTVVSAADEAAQHNNQPSLPKTILVNSVTQFDEAITPNSRSYLQFNGCTNFNSKITIAIPSVSCSSDAVGRAAGMAGLTISAAMNAVARGGRTPHPTCRQTDGDPCAISPNEVRQLMASGEVNGTSQADDVDFSDPELACPAPGCTDPYAALPALVATRPIFSPLAQTKSYPARRGHDQFYGYGRVNMQRAAGRANAGPLPPEVELESPEWYEQVDSTKQSFTVRGTVSARGQAYTCRVLVAPGAYPDDGAGADEGDFRTVPSSDCDGTKSHTGALDGLLATVDVGALKARFPPGTTGGFDGRETGTAPAQTSNGRPNSAPHGFVVKVVARSVQGAASVEGEDRRQGFLHRDADLLPAFPRELRTDGASSPLFVDLDGDNRNELVFGTSDGEMHAMRRDGSSLPGWPVRGDRPPLHGGGRAFATGKVSDDLGGAILASPAAGDLDRDGSPEIVAADLNGKVYVWNASGRRVLTRETKVEYSGKPLSPFVDVRKGKRHRTQRGFIGSPVLADLDGDRRPEIVAAAMDRHVYAWKGDGAPVDGFPTLVVDRSKLAPGGIDPQTHALTFGPEAGPVLNQGAIVNTPAVANIAGDAESPPEIIVGTNEEYRINEGNEGPFESGNFNSATVSVLQQAGGEIGFGVADANGRVFAIHADGEDHAGGPYVDGWPVKIGLLMSELLPIVGEGINGSPIVAPLTCPSGGEGRKVGVMPAAGLAYILNGNGTSCQPQQNGRNTSLQSDVPGPGVDATRFPAVGLPAFGTVAGRTAFLAPVAGVIRALDLAANEYQGGVDATAAWNPETGQYLPNFPAQQNDLSFLTGPAVGDVGGAPGEEIVAGTASMDLQAFSAAGLPTSDRWPRLHGDWMVATPLIGSFGQRETDSAARKVVVALTRRGTVFAWNTTADACAPASSPRFHHDNHNSGDFERDAVAPGRPERLAVGGGKLGFAAPGDDLLCGTAERYEVAHSDSPITGASFGSADAIAGGPHPTEPGERQEVALPPAPKRFFAVRAIDEQGNVGRTATIDTRPTSTEGGGGPSGGGGPAVGGAPGGAAPSKRCLPAKLGVSASRIGPLRLGRSLAALRRRYRSTSRRGVTRFCVRGGRRVLATAKRGRIDLIATTARRHTTRQAAPGRRLPRRGIRGARKRARGILVGTLPRPGRVVYGVKRNRVAYLAVISRTQVKHLRTLARRLDRLGLR